MSNKKRRKEEKLNKVFTSVFDGVLKSAMDELRVEFPELVDKMQNVTDMSLDEFNYNIYHKLKKAVHVGIADKLQLDPYHERVSSLVFLYLNKVYIEHNLNYFIEFKEGSACHVDKSRWLMESFKHYLITEKMFDMTINEKCYWKPHFWSSEVWLELLQALQSFYWGKPMGYVKFMQNHWIPLVTKEK